MSKTIKTVEVRKPSFAMLTNRIRGSIKVERGEYGQKKHGNVAVLSLQMTRRKAKKSRQAMKDVLDIFTTDAD